MCLWEHSESVLVYQILYHIVRLEITFYHEVTHTNVWAHFINYDQAVSKIRQVSS